MDQGIVGSIFTVVVFVAFIGAVWWAFHSKNKAKFDDAANVIFEDDNDKDENKSNDDKLSKKDQES